MVWVHQTVVVTTMKMEVRQEGHEDKQGEDRCSRGSGLFRHNKCKKVL